MLKIRNRARRGFAVILAVCLLLAVLPVNAFAAGTGQYEIYQVESGGFLRIDRFTNTLDRVLNVTGDLVIPSTVGSTTVEHIADNAFDGSEDLTSVVIPASVQTIGDEAFNACISLKSVKLSEGLVTLGKDAFRYCYSLTDVQLPASLTAIESGTFTKCLALQSISVPSGVKRIGSEAFSGCSKLTSVSLPSGITEIGEYAFENCAALASLKLPKSLGTIPTALFNGCTSLKDVTVYGNVKAVGQSAFGGCTGLQKLVLPEGVQRIEQWAFNGCDALTILSVPNSVTSISADAFYGCANVTLYVNAATVAQLFASANKIPFVVGTLDSKPDDGDDPVTPTELPFTDTKGHWAEDEIKWAYSNGYFKGTTATTFAPNEPVNRAMLVEVLYRIEGRPQVGSADFSDVPDNAYYADAVAWAQNTKVVDGVGDGKFAPSRNITREQLATMLHRYAQYKKKDTSAHGDMSKFTDNSSISSYAGTAMAWAVGAGIVTGVTSTEVDPGGRATRAQSVVMLRRFTKLTQ